MCADGEGYPQFSWPRGSHGDFACPDGVEMADLRALAMAWLAESGQDAYSYACDANNDGATNMLDYAILAGGWLTNAD
jgi:hypothetical protein